MLRPELFCHYLLPQIPQGLLAPTAAEASVKPGRAAWAGEGDVVGSEADQDLAER